MSTTYGDNNEFEDIRTAVVALMNGLKTQMVTDSVVPAIASVYNKPTADPNITFNAVAVSMESADLDVVGVFAGPVATIIAQVTIRVMIGNADAEVDEVVFWQLANSIENWINERRSFDIAGAYDETSPQFVLLGSHHIELIGLFEDTQTVGGIVSFPVRAWNVYESA